MSTWKERLDARISRCSGCDQLIWDGQCSQCDQGQEERVA